MSGAKFGTDFVQHPEGRHQDTMRARLVAGAEVRRDEQVTDHWKGEGLGTRELVVSRLMAERPLTRRFTRRCH